MIDITKEQMLSLKMAARLIPGRDGKPVHLSTIWRWILKGRRGVKLESIVIGGSRFTSREAMTRFIEALNPEQQPVGTIRTSQQRLRASERAAEDLERAGI
jgi:hypothetical protein